VLDGSALYGQGMAKLYTQVLVVISDDLLQSVYA
jgi:hypothetical protein